LTSIIRLFPIASFIAIASTFYLSILLNAAFGVLYDTDHFGDTLFLLGAAWRVNEGLTPVLDFGHFYGGVVAQGISFTIDVFGHSVFVIDYFTMIAAFLLSVIAGVILRTRLSWYGLVAVIVVVTTLLLTRHPLEMSQSITQIVSTHSFIYNRFALAALLVIGIFVALPDPNKTRDGLLAVLIGVLIALVCLTKPTFVVLIIGSLLALLVQTRWAASLGIGFGLVATFLLLDPWLARFVGSFEYALAHVGGSNGIGGLIRKAIQIPLAQPVAFLLSLAALMALLIRGHSIKTTLAILIMAGTGVGLATTMGGNGSLGQLALPIIIMVTLATAEITKDKTFGLINTCLILAFCGTHLLNTLGSTAESVSARNQSLISDGPYTRYVSIPERKGSDPTQYEMFADGIVTLNALGDPSQWGIISDNGISFEYTLLARPVPEYPLWQRSTAPEFATEQPFPPTADIVLLGRFNPSNAVQQILRAKMGDAFVVCATSQHWEVLRRTTLETAACPL
jgi:hypothetical protein